MIANNFFPFFINLSGKKILIIGAGKIAARKINSLLNLGCFFTVISRDALSEDIDNLIKNSSNINFINQEIDNASLRKFITREYFMVIAATDNISLNEEIVKFSDSLNILSNNITSKTNMNLRFSSVIEEEDYIIGISAKGHPKKALNLKEKIKKLLND